MRHQLIFRTPEGERAVELETTAVVGRDPDSADIAFANERLSRRHAEFAVTPDGVTVRDLGSRNGIVVNGTRVESHVFRPGDVVLLGDIGVTLESRRSSTQAVIGEPAPPVAPESPSADLDKTIRLPRAAPAPPAAPPAPPEPPEPPSADLDKTIRLPRTAPAPPAAPPAPPEPPVPDVERTARLPRAAQEAAETRSTTPKGKEAVGKALRPEDEVEPLSRTLHVSVGDGGARAAEEPVVWPTVHKSSGGQLVAACLLTAALTFVAAVVASDLTRGSEASTWLRLLPAGVVGSLGGLVVAVLVRRISPGSGGAREAQERSSRRPGHGPAGSNGQ